MLIENKNLTNGRLELKEILIPQPWDSKALLRVVWGAVRNSLTCSCDRIGKLCWAVGMAKNCLWVFGLVPRPYIICEPVTNGSGSHQQSLQWHRNAALPQSPPWDHWSELVSAFPWAQTRNSHHQALCLQGGAAPFLGCWACLNFTVLLGLNDLKFLFFLLFSEAGASDFCLTGTKCLTELWIASKKYF